MDFTNVCRTCLGTKSLSPIFRDQLNHNRYSLAVYLITGVKVYINDGLPQSMCMNCINFLNQAFKFRQSCKSAQAELLKFQAQLNNQIREVSNTEIDVETRKPTIKTRTHTILTTDDIVDSCDIKSVYDNYIIDNSDYEDDKPLKYLIEFNNVDENLLVEKKYCTEYPISPADVIKNELISTTKGEDHLENTPMCDSDASIKNDTEETSNTFVINDQKVNLEKPYEIVSENRVTCKMCHKDLSIRSIDSHMARTHPGADLRKVKCELCDAYVLKEKLKRHMGMVHAGRARCGYCKTEFENTSSLMEHIQSCNSKKKKRKGNDSGRELKECEICHKTMQKASLKMHIAIKHAGLGPVCEHCGRRFGNKFRLNEHYRAKHGYEKFRCSYCEFQSAGVMAMRNHERRHRGEKPFVCETCGAKFHAAYLLAQHKQSHRTERLVKCDQCSASFKANNSLHMHKSTCHSGSAYQCAVCGRAYRCRHYVVKHMRQVHSYRGPVARGLVPVTLSGDIVPGSQDIVLALHPQETGTVTVEP